MTIEHRLHFKPKISRRAAHEMIMLFAKWGNRNLSIRPSTDGDVKRLFSAHGMDYARLVEECRTWPQSVPLIEDFARSTWEVVSGTASRVNNETGQEDLRVTAPGTITLEAYRATFECAVEARDRAVQRASAAEFASAVIQGIASIEGFVAGMVESWNQHHPHDQLIDSAENKVRLEEKIRDWIPKMTKGKKFPIGTKVWQDFRILQAIRNDSAVHPKASGVAISLADLASRINMFRTGIAQFLVELHLLCGQRIPAVIIRAAYEPDVEVIAEERE